MCLFLNIFGYYIMNVVKIAIFAKMAKKRKTFSPANVCINKEEHIYCHYQYSGLAPSGRRVKKIVKYYSFCNKRAKHLISSDYLGGP